MKAEKTYTLTLTPAEAQNLMLACVYAGAEYDRQAAVARNSRDILGRPDWTAYDTARDASKAVKELGMKILNEMDPFSCAP